MPGEVTGESSAPSVCRDPKDKYKTLDVKYLELDAQDDRSFPLLTNCLASASAFISECHAEERPVLVHCMAGVNRSATLAVAHLLLVKKRNLFELFAECSAARPSILQNPSFQLQLCVLAHTHGLLREPDERAISRALLSEPPRLPSSVESHVPPPVVELASAAELPADFAGFGEDEGEPSPAPAPADAEDALSTWAAEKGSAVA